MLRGKLTPCLCAATTSPLEYHLFHFVYDGFFPCMNFLFLIKQSNVVIFSFMSFVSCLERTSYKIMKTKIWIFIVAVIFVLVILDFSFGRRNEVEIQFYFIFGLSPSGANTIYRMLHLSPSNTKGCHY